LSDGVLGENLQEGKRNEQKVKQQALGSENYTIFMLYLRLGEE